MKARLVRKVGEMDAGTEVTIVSELSDRTDAALAASRETTTPLYVVRDDEGREEEVAATDFERVP